MDKLKLGNYQLTNIAQVKLLEISSKSSKEYQNQIVNHSQNNDYQTSLILVTRLLCIYMNISVSMLVRINHLTYSLVLLYRSNLVIYIFQE